MSYKDAVHALNLLQSNTTTLEKVQHDRKRELDNISNMIRDLNRIGIQEEEYNKLPVIHISGTKGKGSTGAFCESILRHCGYKTGFFSSPHLVKVTERIRVEGQPLENTKFCRYFWEVYNKMKETETLDLQMPPYFAFLTVMAVHAFIEEKVDVAIFEVGLGGEYDSTNFFKFPVVCGVTSLGLDHTSILGDTLGKIAWQKAGIFKPRVPVVTVSHLEESMAVLLARSKQIGSPLYMAPALDQYVPNQSIKLGIAGSMQAVNATLALQLCRIWLDNHGQEVCNRKWLDQTEAKYCADIPEIPAFSPTDAMLEGLKSCNWPGRNQIVRRPRVSYNLDGAHTKESIQQCVQWFQEESRRESEDLKGRVCKILIFNITGDRNVKALLSLLKVCEFDGAVFTPNLAYAGHNTNTADQAYNKRPTMTKEKQLETYKENQNIWNKIINEQELMFLPTAVSGGLSRTCVSHAFPCIEQTLHWAVQGRDPSLTLEQNPEVPDFPESMKLAWHIQILVTGSLHLVGGVLGFLFPELRY